MSLAGVAGASASVEITLSPLAERHRDATLAWMNDPELMRLLHREHVISRSEHEAWFARLGGDESSRYYAVEAGGRHLGNIWLVNIDRRNRKAEVRVLLGESAGQGIGPRAMELLCHLAFTELGLHRLYAYVLDFNPRAARAFEKAGFVREGRLRDDRQCGDHFVDAWLLARVHDS